ncbi:MAG TPA: hypothetical protein VLJ39_05930 [Tepidisphaeraceae bacterium]|nr:hypothetical protein [Tepidisphaeraceae bacterium]
MQVLPTDRPVFMLETGEMSFASPAVQAQFCDVAAGNLSERGAHVMRLQNLSQDQKARIADPRLALLTKRAILVSTFRDKTPLMPALAGIRQTTGAAYLAFPESSVFVGTAGGWDPNSGRVWDRTSTTSLKLTVVSLADGQVVWQNELFIRAAANSEQIMQWTPRLFDPPGPNGAKQ